MCVAGGNLGNLAPQPDTRSNTDRPGFPHPRRLFRLCGLPSAGMPAGLRKNDPLPAPLITPTTKALLGGRDELLTRDEILAGGLVAIG